MTAAGGKTGDATHLDLDRRAVGDDVDGVAAVNDPGLERRMRRAEARVKRPLGREPRRPVADEEQELRRRIERILAEGRVRGMAGTSLDNEFQGLLAFMRQNRLHLGRLPDDAARRPGAERGEALDHVTDAAAADLLVVGKGDMYRTRQRHAEEFRNHGEHAGEEALHVGRAASRQAHAVRREAERIGRPDLPLGRDHVHMAGEDIARLVPRPDRREEVESVAFGAGDHRALDPVAREFGPHPIDDRRIGGSRQRRDRHKIGEDGFDLNRHSCGTPRCGSDTDYRQCWRRSCQSASRSRNFLRNITPPFPTARNFTRRTTLVDRCWATTRSQCVTFRDKRRYFFSAIRDGWLSCEGAIDCRAGDAEQLGQIADRILARVVHAAQLLPLPIGQFGPRSLPLAHAIAMPSRVRRRIRSVSNSAKVARMLKNILPIGSVGS